MAPKLITYLIGLISFGYLIINIYLYKKNKKAGYGYKFPIFKIVGAVVVFCIFLYAMMTGQTYDDLISSINGLF